MEPLILVCPYGSRSLRIELPRDVARWLLAELAAALGEPRPRRRRPVRLRRGRWHIRDEREELSRALKRWNER